MRSRASSARSLPSAGGSPVIVENRPGAAGTTGSTVVANATPDGYTLLASPAGPLVINRFVQKAFSFDPLQLTPITVMAGVPTVLAIRSSLPAKSVSRAGRLCQAAEGRPELRIAGAGLDVAPFGRAVSEHDRALRWCMCPTRAARPRWPIWSAAISISCSTISVRRWRCIAPARSESWASARAARSPSLPGHTDDRGAGPRRLPLEHLVRAGGAATHGNVTIADKVADRSRRHPEDG